MASFAPFAQTAGADSTNRFVAWNSATAASPYTNWITAASNIQDAIDAAYASDVIWVSNGVYETGGRINYPTGTVLTNRVVIDKAVTVRSANNDPTNTIIRGAWNSTATNGLDAVRCVYLTNGSSLIGFTLTNGATLALNQPAAGTNANHYGGGIYCPTASTIISNCVIAGNAASYAGGGVAFGIIGGTYYGALFNCRIAGNSAGRGGGTWNCVVFDSTIASNSAEGTAGGALYGVLSNCTVIGNSALSGGGGAYMNFYNCAIISNRSTGNGGGVYGAATGICKLYNCTVVGNSAVNGGGAINQCLLYNCTIVNNSASSTSGGVGTNGCLYNCIVYFNDAPSGSNYSGIISITNSCTTPMPAIGTGNIAGDPLFIDRPSGNYRLQARSPCINTGTNGSWTTSYPYDLDGRARIRYGTVDMGAYERLHKGTICGVH